MDNQKLEGQKPETMQQVANKTAIDAASALIGLKKTNSTVPSYKPKSFLDQIYLYKNGADYKLYVYLNNEWKSTTLS